MFIIEKYELKKVNRGGMARFRFEKFSRTRRGNGSDRKKHNNEDE